MNHCWASAPKYPLELDPSGTSARAVKTSELLGEIFPAAGRAPPDPFIPTATPLPFPVSAASAVAAKQSDAHASANFPAKLAPRFKLEYEFIYPSSIWSCLISRFALSTGNRPFGVHRATG